MYCHEGVDYPIDQAFMDAFDAAYLDLGGRGERVLGEWACRGQRGGIWAKVVVSRGEGRGQRQRLLGEWKGRDKGASTERGCSVSGWGEGRGAGTETEVAR